MSSRGQASAERTGPEGVGVEIRSNGDIYISKMIEQRMATDGWESVKYIEYTVLHSTVADWRYNTAPSELPPDSISFQLR